MKCVTMPLFDGYFTVSWCWGVLLVSCHLTTLDSEFQLLKVYYSDAVVAPDSDKTAGYVTIDNI